MIFDVFIHSITEGFCFRAVCYSLCVHEAAVIFRVHLGQLHWMRLFFVSCVSGFFSDAESIYEIFFVLPLRGAQ